MKSINLFQTVRRPVPKILNFRDFCASNAAPLELQEAFNLVLQYFRLLSPCEKQGRPCYVKFTSQSGFVMDPIALVLHGSLDGGRSWQIFSSMLQTADVQFEELMSSTDYVLRPFFPGPLEFYRDLQAVHDDLARSPDRHHGKHMWEIEMKHLARQYGLVYQTPYQPLPLQYKIVDVLNFAAHGLKKLVPSL